ncbi:MAG: UDP-N-acetylmuramoyl-L-alanyl-D-glutamate--2,6-diaminopimelate ligase [Spirochaetaceae bacterium]|jgi:UDP-N-acetylmuramoyl-L-alanyl-D-glutamate--2,6-diaminopimelate ligase|nr:UDP-N-acetylmuramoyl-L-alanyl-D-glutamate--2,6-diaminopimelate ligase [Spirochaetaceae bacterium]
MGNSCEKKWGDFWTDELARRCGAVNVRPTSGTEQEDGCLVTGLTYDSRQVQEGVVYFALTGLHADGHAFIQDAVGRGAKVIVYEKALSAYQDNVLYVQVKDSRFAMSPLADAFYGQPSRRLTVVGVTGTEGKTSTVSFIFQLLSALGKKAGFISTVQYSVDGEVHENPEHQTTPEATVIHRQLAEMLDNGLSFAIIESSSHGLSSRTNRLGDVRFDVGVMTNVTHEHLEFHGDWETYRNDKANLFRAAEKFCVVNADDPSAAYFTAATRVPVLSFSASGGNAGLSIRDIEPTDTGNRYVMCRQMHEQIETRVEDNLPGAFNAGNVAAALLTVAELLNVPPETLVPYVQQLKPVRGRMTAVDRGQDFEVLVDYAHTPSSFETIFPPLRARLDSGSGEGCNDGKRNGGKHNDRHRIIAVFGSAGDRDWQKRPRQGRIASKWSDIIILTDEDPRGEVPIDILNEIASGFEPYNAWIKGKNLFFIPNRPKAIAKAVSLAGKGDVVLLLGKGHENSIIYGDHVDAYDEIECVKKALCRLPWRR